MAELSGRIEAVPAAVWDEEVLAPQFAADLAALPAFVAVEKALLAEHRRLGLLDAGQTRILARALDRIRPEDLTADPAANMSDIAFAVERLAGGDNPPPAWHVDRSRNDLQATAQLLTARDRLRLAAAELLDFARTAADVAGRTAGLPMPGYTHLQAAQVVTPGFFLAAVVAETLRTARRLLATDEEIDLCPLGAGAMAGQELDWDRDALAAALGFRGPQPHALVAVASRDWALAVSADLSVYGVTLSRLATDLMAWGSSAYGFLDLPDALSGISSAMPQKKNFPVLERIRGRTAHLTSAHLDAVLAQRNTPYANSVEVGKEAAAGLPGLFAALASTLRLFGTVLARLEFRADRMRAAAEAEFLGGFTLANRLTLRAGIPWRTAQVLGGRYVTARTGPVDPDLLARLAADAGHPLEDPGALLDLDVDTVLAAKRSAGGAAPDSVRELLARQRTEIEELAAEWATRSERVTAALAALDRDLGLAPDRAPAGEGG